MSRNSKPANILLWTTQVLLALLFAYAGGIKFVLPLEVFERGPIPLPGSFVRFIGLAEVLGALGLVLPGLFRIRTDLTPLAAVGLVCIMSGATVLTAQGLGLRAALLPFVTGLLALAVCIGRRDWVRPHSRGALLGPTVLTNS